LIIFPAIEFDLKKWHNHILTLEKNMSDFPQIPGYKIEKKLGEGGMATVYQGIQEKLNRKVAIKVLEPSLLKNETIRNRFAMEAETAAMLIHSNIISIYDIGKTDTYYYIVMEFLEETLKEHTLGFPDFRLKPETALEILKPIIRALDYAHSVGFIHRDIKAENIMFRRDGTPVLVDFGIARALESDSRMTRTGISLGTPYYMSPEQCKAEPLDGRSDIYSLGVVFYEVITGERPYEADNPTAVAIKHVQAPVPRLPQKLSFYQVLIDKMMAKDKEKRVADGKELIKLIDAVLSAAQDSISLPDAEPVQTEPPKPEPLPHKLIKSEPSKTNPAFKMGEEIRLEDIPGPQNFIEKTQPFRALPPTPSKTTAIRKTNKKKFPVKPLVEAAVLVSLLLVVFIIFFNLGSNKNKETSQSTPSINTQINTQKPAVKTVKDTTPIPRVTQDELQTKIDEVIKENEIVPEKKTDPTNVTTKPQTQTKPKPQDAKALRLLDDQTYDTAAKINTVEAFQSYINDNPTGRHINDAISKIAKLKETERMVKEAEKKSAAPKLKFRSTYKTLGNYGEVESMIRRYDFYDDSFNKSGSFKNKYAKTFIGNDTVITDEAAGLMWYAGPLSPAANFKKAEAVIKTLNRNKYGGFTDWRLPTLEEAASLLKRKNIDNLYIDPEFPNGLIGIWTGDQQRFQTYWTVNFYKGIVYADSDLTDQQALPVRTIK
jgi:serine/threonine protein kinase